MTEGPTRLRDLLGSAGRKLGMDSPEESARLFSSWTDIVGPEVAAHARPASLKNGILKVWVDSPPWATEITYLAPHVIARASEVLAAGVVTEIRPYLGNAPQRGPAPAMARHGDGPEQARRADEGTSEDDPLGALARARRAWEKRVSKGRSGGRSGPLSDRQIPR